MNSSFFEVDSEEGPYTTGKIYAEGNLGHRPGIKGGYFPVPPVDAANDLRGEMVSVLAEMGLTMDKHHHEVAPSQHELGLAFSTLVRAADNVQIYKYGVQMVAQTYGKTATFMPKPIAGDNGSGMHPKSSGRRRADLCRFRLCRSFGNLFAYRRDRQPCQGHQARQPVTNSYKRLILVSRHGAFGILGLQQVGFLGIPFASSRNGKRVEVRFPDPLANRTRLSAMLMAGPDGIQNRIHLGDAMDKNLYDLPPEELVDIPLFAVRFAKLSTTWKWITSSSSRAVSSPKTRSKAMRN